jgi:PKD repeat protein
MNPVLVTYNTAGWYKVTLTAYSAGGLDSVVKTDFIKVDPTWADISYNGFYSEGFESQPNLYSTWNTNNWDNNANTWYLANTGYQSSKCAVMSAFGDFQYDIDELISPSFDLSFTSGNSLTFKIAAASHGGTTADINDVLKFYATKNCGVTWNLLATYQDSSLINNGYQANYFVPNSSSIWTTKTVNLSSIFSVGNVRFKFEYTSGSESNNIYIDNINIAGVVGIDENNDATASLSIYPNPTDQSSTIAYRLEKKANTKIEVVDVLGKTVFVQVNAGQAEGDYSVSISKQNLNLRNGIYFVKFSVDDKATTKKLIITE